MSLTLSLNNALTGLQAAQQNLALISANIANANTPGYSRQVLPATTQIIQGQGGGGVEIGVAGRVTDDILNSNLRSQDSVTSAASTLDSYLSRVQDLFGHVGNADAVTDTLSKFSSALQTLAATPEDTVAQTNAVSAGQALASQLNSISSGLQTLRSNADTDIGSAVTQANTLIQKIANYNGEIAHARAFNQSTATLEDQRDQALQQLSQQLDIQAFTRADDSVVVLTSGGKTLVNGIAEQLSFTPSGTVVAGSPVSGVSINGLDITSEIHGGTIGALLQVRDKEVPALTSEFNQFTNALYNATQVSKSTQTQTLSSGTLTAGDTFTVTIDGTPHTTAGLAGTATITDLANAINAALPAGTTFSASVTGANAITITDSKGNPLTSSIVLASGTGGETFTAGTPANALPTTDSGLSGPPPGDAHHFFANVNTATGIDNAATIEVNPSLVANPGLLDGVAGTPSPTIAGALSDSVALSTPTFPSAGNFPAPLTLTLSQYAGQILGQSATAAATAHDDSQFQTGVQSEISTRAQSVSAVNLDQELANLSIYQTAYSASARVVQTVNNLFNTLLQIQT
jgi:flagellar hook-associated protein 1